MGRALAARFPVAARTFAEAEEALGEPLTRLCFEGPDDRLALTEYAQPAILTTSVATARVLAEEIGLVPDVVAGHSLGEWSALVVAEALTFADAVRGVRERGRLMQEAVPVGIGAMAAVMGLAPEAVATLCAEAAGADVLAPANLNGGGQVVVAGHARAVDRLVALAGGRRLRVRRLPVSAPFHCSLMAPVAAGLARWIAGIAVADPRIPVITSVDARRVRDARDVRDLLVRQVTAPVRWEETLRVAAGDGACRLLEVGPGRVLSALAGRVLPGRDATPVGTPDDVAGLRSEGWR